MMEVNTKSFGEKTVECDLCVVGGGLAGMCAAISAARRGVKVVLLQDRPVLGGNASSEVRMWVRGAGLHFPLYREGGIVEELAMDNTFLNPEMQYPLWDAVLYEKVVSEKNIDLYLNTSCISAQPENGTIRSVTAWRMTSYTFLTVKAKYFADCSGDSILAETTGANFRLGREGKAEFGEKGAPNQPDTKTMGNSCLLQARERDHEIKFVAPSFAWKFQDGDFAYRLGNRIDLSGENFWWLEIGGDGESLKNADEYNQELIARAYGAWDYIKNSGKYPESANWELDWVGFLAGKRESRRYEGDIILTQNDLETARAFDDEVAYGGWGLDDHNPKGVKTTEPPNVNYAMNAPYPVPYRALYSNNIDNLFFAGRNISATHMALSSTRVMATCAIFGQAVGTAASIANKYGISPRGVLDKIDELQQALRDDDCYLLHTPRKISKTILKANSNLTDEQKTALFNGIEREVDEGTKPAVFALGAPCEFTFAPTAVKSVRIVFDNDLARKSYPKSQYYGARCYPNKCATPIDGFVAYMPPCFTKAYSVEVLCDGVWTTVKKEKENKSRLVKIPVDKTIEGVRLINEQTYGESQARVFSVDIVTD